MYITCPECYTSFTVKASQIGPKGRRVRCSKCDHGWFASGVKSGNKAGLSVSKYDRVGNSNEDFKPGVNLPALLPVKIPFYLYIAPIFLAAAIILTSMIFFQDKMSLLGLTGASENLKIKDIQIAYDREHGNIIANYKIVNTSEEFVPLSQVRIRLLDQNHRILKSHVANESTSNLAPRQFVSIRTRFSDTPSNVEFIDITLGNMLDFLLR